jgi:hypothetical protein
MPAALPPPPIICMAIVQIGARDGGIDHQRAICQVAVNQRSDAEHIFDVLRGHHILRRSFLEDTAILEHHQPVAEAACQREIMQRDGYAQTRSGQRCHKFHHFELVLDIEVRRGLIQQQEARLLSQRPGDDHPLPLSAGCLSDAPVGQVLDSCEPDSFADYGYIFLRFVAHQTEVRITPHEHSIKHGEAVGK